MTENKNRMEVVKSGQQIVVTNGVNGKDFYLKEEVTAITINVGVIFQIPAHKCLSPDKRKSSQKKFADNQSNSNITETAKVEDRIEEVLTTFEINWKGYLNKEFADFTFMIDETQELIPSHKRLLVAKSSVLREMFTSNPNLSKLNLQNTTVEALKLFLCFVYFGRYVGSDTAYTAHLVRVMANHFDVPKLAEEAHEDFCRIINTNCPIKVIKVTTVRIRDAYRYHKINGL